MSDCTFVILGGAGDGAFFELIVKHLLRACAYPFTEVIVVADDLPKKNRPMVDIRNFDKTLARLQTNGTVTRVVRLNEIDRNRGRISRKYFGSQLPHARDHRGVPMLGWLAGIEEATSDFIVHFDSDILLHQDRGFSWIASGMALMTNDPNIMFVAPLPGPPATDGELKGQATTPARDDVGNFRFKTFSSRRFLVNKQRLNKLLPTPLLYTSPRRELLMRFGFGNALLPWEECVSRALTRSKYDRVHLGHSGAWAVHCTDHGPEWSGVLPNLIDRIEEGTFPEAQAGFYDLILPAWPGTGSRAPRPL